MIVPVSSALAGLLSLGLSTSWQSPRPLLDLSARFQWRPCQ